MADNVSPSADKDVDVVPRPDDPAPDSSSSEDQSSTKSSELKTPDEEATLDSEPSASSQVNKSSDDSSNKEESSRSETPQASTSAADNSVQDSVLSGEPSDEVALIPRRRIRDLPQEDEEVHVIEQIVEQQQQPAAPEEQGRRSPSDRCFQGIVRRLEDSNSYIANFFCGWQAFSIFVTDTKYLVIAQILLICGSMAFICFGTEHLHNCKGSPELPALLIVLGILGMIAMCFRMMYVLYKNYATNQVFSKAFRKVIFLMNCIYIVILCGELYTYLSIVTSDNPENSDYCHPNLISYVLAYNCIAFLTVVLSLLLHGPAYLFYSWEIGGPGIPDTI